MRVIIAGSRGITEMRLVEAAVKASGFEVTEVISGGARGVDSLAIEWAKARGLPCHVFRPNWVEGRGAGFRRNEEMARNADALVAVWDGDSRGTKDMIERAGRHCLKVFVLDTTMGVAYGR